MSLRSRLAVVACSVAACTFVLPACSHNTVSADSHASPAVTQARASLPQSVTNNAKDYIAKLESFNTRLEGVNSKNTALKALPNIAESAESINKLTAQLSALSPDVKSKLGTAYGDQFSTLNSDFASNANRLMGSADTSKLFKSTFDNIRLLGQTKGGRWNSITTAAIDAEYGN
jgi:hypothetical protein